MAISQKSLAPPLSDPQLDALRLALPRLFGNLDEGTFAAIRPHLDWQWVERSGGEVLFREGDPSDALYVLMSGRLQASVQRPGAAPEVVGEIGRGEIVGEMGVFADAPRHATITALRDCVLARIEVPAFQEILKAFPALTLNLNRVIIERLQQRNSSQKPTRNVTNLAVLSVSEGLEPGVMLAPLLRQFQSQTQPGLHLTSEMVDAAAGRVGAAQATASEPEAYRWLAGYLDELEARYCLVFYEADSRPTAWTQRCLRQADEVLLLGLASASPELSAIESEFLSGEQPLTPVRQTLALLHPAGTEWAVGTVPFLARRPHVHRHFQVRDGVEKDVARLARFLSGKAVGLVLAGGGARGLAHIGILRAIDEAGVPIDAIGGTSIGSVLGACYACDWGWQRIFEVSRRGFLSNPTSDFNLLPLVSLLAGRKLNRILTPLFGNYQIEEMWLPYFCVSSNYTRACEVVHTHGHLRRALLASMAIPGVFPPIVHGNDLLVDGGVFNNMPVDIMARTGVQTIMAVDLRPEEDAQRELTFDQVPRTWSLLLDRLKPLAKRRYHLPSLLQTLMSANTLNSYQKMTQVLTDVDLLFRPEVRRFGLLEWKSYDVLVEQGYRHAQEVLARHPWPFSSDRAARSATLTGLGVSPPFSKAPTPPRSAGGGAGGA